MQGKAAVECLYPLGDGRKTVIHPSRKAPAQLLSRRLLLLETMDTLGIAKDTTPIIDPLARVR